MTILFIGSEAEDFILTGSWFSTTNASRFRSTYTRQAIGVSGGTSFLSLPAFAAQTTLWFTARVCFDTSYSANFNIATFYDGSNIRLRLRVSSTAGTSTLFVDKFDGSTATVLGTSTSSLAATTLYKLDIGISYANPGYVRVYLDNAIIIDSGSVNVTAGGSTSLSGIILGSHYTAGASNWSEVIVANEDTRPLSVKTLVPNATGDLTGWTAGTWADIDDVTAADVDLAVSDTAAQVLAVNCTGMPTGASNLSVRAVKSVVLAARGASGPSKIDIGLRQSSTSAFASSQTLDTGYGAFSATWTVNPITAAAFTAAEVEAIQLAYRSAT